MHAVSIPSDQGESRMKHPFNVAMTALAMCIATHAFATEGTAELQSETTLAQELNLSSAQVEQIKGLREQATRELGSIKLDAIGQDVIVNMIKSGKWDEVAARKQLQTISDVQAEARYHRAHYLFEVSRVLTPEQKAKLHEMLRAAKPCTEGDTLPVSPIPASVRGCYFSSPMPLFGQAPPRPLWSASSGCTDPRRDAGFAPKTEIPPHHLASSM